MAEYIDSGKVIRSGSPAVFDNVITKDGVAMSVAGKTVTATVRATLVPNTVIGTAPDDLEDIAVTNGGTVAEANGGVTWPLTAAMSALLGPGSGVLADEIVYYDVAYKVMPDGYLVSELLRFGVTRGLD